MATGDTGDWLVVGEALLEHVTVRLSVDEHV
jgi:hypothetical protein